MKRKNTKDEATAEVLEDEADVEAPNDALDEILQDEADAEIIVSVRHDKHAPKTEGVKHDKHAPK